jgi:hypothetical protein
MLGRAQPHVPVEVVFALAVRPGFFIDGPAVVPLAAEGVAVIGALAHDHLAYHAVGNRLLGLPPDVGRSGLRAHLQDAFGLLDRVHQLMRFLVGVSHGLFEVDVLALVHGVHRDLGVPVVRGGDDHGVHVGFLGQQLAVVQIPVHGV